MLVCSDAIKSLTSSHIKNLDPPRRTVLLMMTIQGKAPREVASELHISLQRARGRWRSGVVAVKTRLKMEGINLLEIPPPQPPERKTLAVRHFARTEAVSQLVRRAA